MKISTFLIMIVFLTQENVSILVFDWVKKLGVVFRSRFKKKKGQNFFLDGNEI